MGLAMGAREAIWIRSSNLTFDTDTLALIRTLMRKRADLSGTVSLFSTFNKPSPRPR